MYHIKLVDRLSDNETRSRVYSAIRYSVVDKQIDNSFLYKLTFWTDKNVCTQAYVRSDKGIDIPDDAQHVFEAYIMNENGQTIDVLS